MNFVAHFTAIVKIADNYIASRVILLGTKLLQGKEYGGLTFAQRLIVLDFELSPYPSTGAQEFYISKKLVDPDGFEPTNLESRGENVIPRTPRLVYIGII